MEMEKLKLELISVLTFGNQLLPATRKDVERIANFFSFEADQPRTPAATSSPPRTADPVYCLPSQPTPPTILSRGSFARAQGRPDCERTAIATNTLQNFAAPRQIIARSNERASPQVGHENMRGAVGAPHIVTAMATAGAELTRHAASAEMPFTVQCAAPPFSSRAMVSRSRSWSSPTALICRRRACYPACATCSRMRTSPSSRSSASRCASHQP